MHLTPMTTTRVHLALAVVTAATGTAPGIGTALLLVGVESSRCLVRRHLDRGPRAATGGAALTRGQGGWS